MTYVHTGGIRSPNSFDIHLSADLCAMTEDDIFFFLLGGKYFTWLSEKDLRAVRILNFRYTRDTTARYNQNLKSQPNRMLAA